MTASPAPTLRRDTTLSGSVVHLRPLALEDASDLAAIGLDESLWRWTPRTLKTPDDMASYVREALQARDAGTALPFVVELLESDEIVGCTRFGNVNLRHRRLEIGWTWISPACQGTAVNTEMKLLMFDHAFGELGMNRVELKTDARNERSRAAMRAIGCTEEGTLRRHTITDSGFVRDTVYFSVIREEWPDVRAHLQGRLERKRA